VGVGPDWAHCWLRDPCPVAAAAQAAHRLTDPAAEEVAASEDVRKTPYAVDRVFRILQFGSASLYSLGHGGNDAQKTMGIIAGLLFAGGHLGPQFYVPLWVVLSCQAAMVSIGAQK
jgi:phosphate/sulfate permease